MDTSSRHKWPTSWSGIEDPVVPLGRNLYGHPLAGLLWRDNWRRFCWNLDGKNESNWECLLVHRKQGLFLLVCSNHEFLLQQLKS